MSSKLITGCALALLIVVTTPMWLVMLYTLLESTDQPSWVWGVYFAYTPLSFLTAILTGVAQSTNKEEN